MRILMTVAVLFSLVGLSYVAVYPDTAAAQANCKPPKQKCPRNPLRCC
ncbi:MAG: hypothetical protein SFW09_07325 [Hyphomicrobiaceae bacterium]|nr:hypothetical protein [Hyphomicrobiaceae bacterium]